MKTPTAEFALTHARTRLLLDNVHKSAAFLATCAMHLKFVADPAIPTMRTNGTTLWYNPEWVLAQSESRLQAGMAHEVSHCYLEHCFRRGTRDPHTYNVAADHVINLPLKAEGYDVGDDWLCDPQYTGMSTEAVYAKLRSQEPPEPEPDPDAEPPEDPEDNDMQDGEPDASDAASDEQDEDGAPAPLMPGCETGDFIDAPDDAQQADAQGNPGPPPMTAQDWAIVAEEARLTASAAGEMSGALSRMIEATREPAHDWKEELRQFVIRSVPTDQSWATPNRRFVGGGLYLPGSTCDSVGEIAVAIDTSGSVTSAMLDSFAAHLNSIMREVEPERVHVVYVDADVQGAETFERGDEIHLDAKGGGGTKFQPAFDWIAQQDLSPLVLIYLTDLDNYDVPTDPGYPVLWATPIWITKEPAFGNAVRVDVEN